MISLCLLVGIVAFAFISQKSVRKLFQPKAAQQTSSQQQNPSQQRVASYQPRPVTQVTDTLDGLQPVATPPPKYEPPPPPYQAHLREPRNDLSGGTVWCQKGEGYNWRFELTGMSLICGYFGKHIDQVKWLWYLQDQLDHWQQKHEDFASELDMILPLSANLAMVSRQTPLFWFVVFF